MVAPLKLLATDAEDIAVIAACLQDALVPVGDLAYLPAERQFIGVFNRFRWEAGDEASGDARRPKSRYQRILCGLRFDAVRNVKLRGIDRSDSGLMLQLLTIEPSADQVMLIFADGVACRLEVERLHCVLEDLDDPWPT